MPQVSNQQNSQHGAPDAQVRRGAQDEGLVEGEEEVQVRELGEGRGRGGRDGGGGDDDDGGRGGGVGQGEVGVLLEVGKVGADEGRDGLEEEEEEAVREGQAEARLLLLRWGWWF